MATCQGQAPCEDDIPPTIRLVRVTFFCPNVPHVYGDSFFFSVTKVVGKIMVVTSYSLQQKY